MAHNFDTMLRRFNAFVDSFPRAIDVWLRDASEEVVITTIDSVCFALFKSSIQDDEWKLDVCRSAVRMHLAQAQGVEMDGGICVRIRPAEFKAASTLEPVPLPNLYDLSRIAVLEARVLELEANQDLGDPGQALVKKMRKQLPTSPASACAFLVEKRSQALSALEGVKKKGGGGRKCAKDLSTKHHFIIDPPPILPKRAFSLAGYWNVAHNDILAMTPALVQEVEAKGGRVIRKRGMNVCFAACDADIVRETAAELIQRMMPQKYARRRG
jgi:hypothetical protein